MRIEKAKLLELHLPLIPPFQMSYGTLTEKKFDFIEIYEAVPLSER